MKTKEIRILFIALLTILISCSSPSDKQKILDLKEKVAVLDSIKLELISENENLKRNLLIYEDEKARETKEEKARLEKLKKVSQGLVLDDKVQVVTVKTGYDPYHNMDNLFLPAITLMFKNISNSDISDYIKVRAVFINNTSGEQIAEDYEYLCTNSAPLIAGIKKQITLQSSVGWYALRNQNVSVKISIEDDPFKTYKIKNREYRGRI